jgi:hypothetical protein
MALERKVTRSTWMVSSPVRVRKEVAADADVVAEVEELVERECLLADGVEADVDLEALAALLQGGEAGLALGANGHDAAGDGHGGAVASRASAVASPHLARTSGMVCEAGNWLG